MPESGVSHSVGGPVGEAVDVAVGRGVTLEARVACLVPAKRAGRGGMVFLTA